MLIMEMLLKEIRLLRMAIKQSHDRFDQIENARIKQHQIAPRIHMRAQATRLDGFDRRFDEFTE